MSPIRVLKKFFINYLWLGIVSLLLAIIVDELFEDKSRVILIIIKIVETLGVSLVIASIFSFTTNTKDFLKTITDELSKIVISSNFLKKLSDEQKRKTLGLILKPKIEGDNKIYTNINRYYDFFIENSLSISRTSIRSNHIVEHYVSIDKNTGLLKSKISMYYKIYPFLDPEKKGYCYSPIDCGFISLFQDKINKSGFEKLIIHAPNNYRKDLDFIKNNYSKNDKYIIFKGDERQCKIDLDVLIEQESKKFKEFPVFLSFSLNMVDYGSDNCLLLSFKHSIPSDGFRFIVICEEPIEIDEYAVLMSGREQIIRVFGRDGKELSSNDVSTEDKITKIEIQTDEWVTEATGVSVLCVVPSSQTVSDT